MKKILHSAQTLCVLVLLAAINTASAQTFDIENAGDFGNSHSNYPPSNAIDGNTSFSSRWASTFQGGDANLFVDLGSVKRVDNIGVSWGRGNQRSYVFEVRARRGTSGSWTKVFSGVSSGSTTGIENYNVTDIDARQVRIKVFSNSAGSFWADVTEFEVYGTQGPSGSNSGPADSPTGLTIPGLIEAENFSNFSDSDSANRGGAFRNTGVDIERCSDAGCGYNIGWTIRGEWLDYNVSVNANDAYVAKVRVASARSTGAVSFDIDGQQVSNTVPVVNTGGWQNWITQTINLGLISSGNHTLRLNIEGSSVNVNSIEIVRVSSPSAPDNPTDDQQFNLNANAEPWENFNLTRWALDSPAPRSNDSCKSERTWDYSWDDSNPLSSASQPFFFTHTDGGMRFVTRIDGQTTNNACNSGFVRSELREMLRAGNQSIEDTGVTRNNWKLGYQPGNNSNWGGVNGQLDGTLRVNKVTTTGSSSQVGRVVIGQIHAGNDEPLRLYYRKRVGQSKGCIYFAHEIRTQNDVDFFMIGNEACTSGPSNGIELNELFSYSIINEREDIRVVIRRGDRDGPVIAQRTIDMNSLNSGYNRSDEWMYFKAGAYTQNNTGNRSDGDIVTFYRLSVSHD